MTGIQSPSLATTTQYILVQVGKSQLALPAQWVSEVLLIKQFQIAHLPFYSKHLLGVIHHQGQLLPLLSGQSILLQEWGTEPLRENLTVVRLSSQVNTLAGVGLVVDRLLGNLTAEQLANTPDTQLLQPTLIPPQIWEPQRWVAANPSI